MTNRTYRVTEIVGTSPDGIDQAIRNGIERAVILGSSPVIEAADLGLSDGEARDIHVGALASPDEPEREHIARVIAKVPTLESAARVLGIDATTLSRKRKRYGLA